MLLRLLLLRAARKLLRAQRKALRSAKRLLRVLRKAQRALKRLLSNLQLTQNNNNKDGCIMQPSFLC